MMEHAWDWSGEKSVERHYLSVVDLHDIDNPKLLVDARELKDWDGVFNVVADKIDGERFFVNVRQKIGSSTVGDMSWNFFRYYALPYRLTAGSLKEEKKVNLPGRLVRSFEESGEHILVSRDSRYVRTDSDDEWCVSCNYQEVPTATTSGASLVTTKRYHACTF